jgi:hypothetical protein
MTDKIRNIVEDVSEEVQETEQAAEVKAEEVSEENLESTESEVSEEAEEEVEEVAEAKVKEDDEDEEVEEAAKISIPKTKAGVINAAMEMLKKARKHEAQQLFAKMISSIESTDDGSVDKAIDAQKKKEKDKTVQAKPSDASAKQENVDWDEDLDILVAEEATLSDGFRDKAGTIFQAAYTSKVGTEIDRLESEYAQNLETEVTDIQTEIVEKVDSYLNYVVEGWMKENELAVQQGLRTEIAEEFMNSLQSVFKEHYIEVPEGKADLIDDLADQVAELEEQLNKSTEDNIRLHESAQSYERADIVRKQSSGLAATDAEKLTSLVSDIDFEDSATFETKVKTVRESYFKSEDGSSVDEADAIAGEDTDPNAGSVSDTMSAYTQAISKLNQ